MKACFAFLHIFEKLLGFFWAPLKMEYKTKINKCGSLKSSMKFQLYILKNKSVTQTKSKRNWVNNLKKSSALIEIIGHTDFTKKWLKILHNDCKMVHLKHFCIINDPFFTIGSNLSIYHYEINCNPCGNFLAYCFGKSRSQIISN